MKKILLTGLALAVVGSIAIAGDAMALLLTLDDGPGGQNTYTFTDNVSLTDLDTRLGALLIFRPYGIWSTSINLGSSVPLIGSFANPELDLLSGSFSSTGAGTLTITLADVYHDVADLDDDITSFWGRIGGVTDGTVMVSYMINGVTYSNPNIYTSAFSGSTIAGLTGSGEFDMAIIATVTHAGAGQTTFNAALAPVPEPATMLLFGTGLAGLAGVARRKKK